MSDQEQPMSMLEHLSELRRRLIRVAIVIVIASVIGYFFSGQILELLTRGMTLIYIRPSEALLAHIRLGVTVGLMVSMPMIFYQIIAFLMPALTKREKRILVVAVIMMFFLFIAGLSFAWFVVFPFAMDFFASFTSDQLLPWYTVSDYVAFTSGFLLAFGLVFQMPLIFWILGALGIVSSRFLRTSRRYALLVIAILSALITPPDVVSQVLMIMPMMILFEFGILLVRLAERGRRKRAAELSE